MRQLRAAAALLEQSESDDAARVAAAIRLYEREAPLGRSLDDALGLTARGGAGPWWEQECRNRRDGLIRALRREFFSDLGVSSAATEIATLANVRRHAIAPPRNRQEAMVDAALRTGVKFPGQKRLTAMLGIPVAD